MKPLSSLNLLEVAERTKASQDHWELWQLLETVSTIFPRIIVEIGVHKGYSLQTWQEAFVPSILVGIDNDPQIDIPVNATIMEMDSTSRETITHLRGVLVDREIDFLFIDGDHTYEGVKSDWEMYSPLVRDGGIIGFHDTSRMGEGWMSKVEVRKFVDELCQANSYKYAEFRNGLENPGVVLIWK